jgi:hypothetical protein
VGWGSVQSTCRPPHVKSPDPQKRIGAFCKLDAS